MRIFVASSVKKFEVERGQIAEYFDTLNQAHERDGVRIVWYRPETMSRALVRGGSQLPYNEEITECRFFVLLVGQKIGKHTEEEFNLALERFQKTGKPLIFPYFLNVRADMDVLRFQERLRKELDIDEQYVDTYDNLDVILSHLHIELIRHGAFRREDAELSDREAAADKGLDGIRELIREQEKRIAELDAKPDVTPLIIREKTAAYEEIKRLSQKYDMAPDSLLDYMDFLWKQNLYDDGIELGHWLERFYTLHDPGEAVLARLQNRIGACYYGNAHYKEAEWYWREALEIRRRLAKANPAEFEPDLAKSLHNLAILLYQTKRMEEAEWRYREALEIRRHLAKVNPVTFEPDLAQSLNNLGLLFKLTNRTEEAELHFREALEIQWRLAKANHNTFEPNLAKFLNNLANLLRITDRKEEAEQHYREALEIRRRLAKANPYAFEPDLAKSLNNLAILLDDTNRKEEAERRYREALEIRRRLAKANPNAFEPDLAQSCYNLGLLEWKRDNLEVARRYFGEALSLYEKFPHLESNAQNCRDILDMLDIDDIFTYLE